MGPCDEALALARWLIARGHGHGDEIELAYELMRHGEAWLDRPRDTEPSNDRPTPLPEG